MSFHEFHVIIQDFSYLTFYCFNFFMKLVPYDCFHNRFRFSAHELITDCLFNDSGLPFQYENAVGSTVIIALTTSNIRGN